MSKPADEAAADRELKLIRKVARSLLASHESYSTDGFSGGLVWVDYGDGPKEIHRSP